jgi:hypothetical protein
VRGRTGKSLGIVCSVVKAFELPGDKVGGDRTRRVKEHIYNGIRRCGAATGGDIKAAVEGVEDEV